MAEYRIERVFGEGLVGINGGMWHRAKMRKPHDCEVCARRIQVGETAYATINEHGKLRPRWARICERCVDNGKEQLERASTGS